MNEYLPLLYGVLAVLISIPIHEYAHYWMAQRLGYKPVIRFEKREGKLLPDLVTTWKGTDEEHEFKILLAGVFFGAVPIFSLLLFVDSIGVLPLFMAFVMYIILVRKDAERMTELAEVEV